MGTPASADTSKIEQRIYERFPIILPVEFKHADGEMIAGQVLNVSRGGMYLETPKGLAEGAQAFFRVQLPAQTLQFHLQGEVVWSKKIKNAKRGMGIRFVASPTQNEGILQNLLSVLHPSL